MPVLRKFKAHIARKSLLKKYPPTGMEKKIIDFDRASRIGILFHTSDPDALEAIKNFTAYLKRRTISFSVLGYVPARRIPADLLVWQDIHFITKRDCNWLGIPGTEPAKEFLGTEFDVLINCSIHFITVLEQMAQTVNASVKIGTSLNASDTYDVTINVSQDNSVLFFLENVKFYMPHLANQCLLRKQEN